LKITAFSLRRPVTTLMIFITILILGGISLFKIPLEFMPKADFPMIQIDAPYRSSSPLEVKELITEPLEEAISSLSGVEKITSGSSTQGAQIHPHLHGRYLLRAL